MLYIYEENRKQFVAVRNVKLGADSINVGASFFYVWLDEELITK